MKIFPLALFCPVPLKNPKQNISIDNVVKANYTSFTGENTKLPVQNNTQNNWIIIGYMNDFSKFQI